MIFSLLPAFDAPVVRDEQVALHDIQQLATRCRRFRNEVRTPSAMERIPAEQRALVGALVRVPAQLVLIDGLSLDGTEVWANQLLNNRTLFECALPFVATDADAADRLRPMLHITLERAWRGSPIHPEGYSPNALFDEEASLAHVLDLDDAGLRSGAAAWLGFSSAQDLYNPGTLTGELQRAHTESRAWLGLAAELAPTEKERAQLYIASANLSLFTAGRMADAFSVTPNQLAHGSPLRASQQALQAGVEHARRGWLIAQELNDLGLLRDATEAYGLLVWRESKLDSAFVLAGDPIATRDLLPTSEELGRITELLSDPGSETWWGLRALEPRVMAATRADANVDEMVFQLIADAASHARVAAHPVCEQLALGRQIDLGAVRHSTWVLATATLGCAFP